MLAFLPDYVAFRCGLRRVAVVAKRRRIGERGIGSALQCLCNSGAV
jgi:hypothetical protein